MGKKKGKSGRLPPFVALTWKVLNSGAYKKLPSSAAKALPYFLGKVKSVPNDPDRYTTSFTFTYSEAKKYGFSKTTFYKILSDLVKLKFIEVVKKGGMRAYGMTSTSFKLSKGWEYFGTPLFKEGKWKELYPTKELRQVTKVDSIRPKYVLKRA